MRKRESSPEVPHVPDMEFETSCVVVIAVITMVIATSLFVGTTFVWMLAAENNSPNNETGGGNRQEMDHNFTELISYNKYIESVKLPCYTKTSNMKLIL